MSRIEWDTSQVDRLAAELSRAPGRIQRSAARVLLVGANKIKAEMRKDASGHDYLPGLARTVNYDQHGPLDYEIGFDKTGQGNLANFAAFGSVNNAPVLDHTAGLRKELPNIMRHLGDEAEESVLGGDGQ